MRLTNKLPPNGYTYFEPSLNWHAPQELALQGLVEVANALSVVRAQNPASGLDPSMAACIKAVKDYTCARLAYRPTLLMRYCEPEPEDMMQVAVSEPPLTVKPIKRAGGGCASCGGRRR